MLSPLRRAITTTVCSKRHTFHSLCVSTWKLCPFWRERCGWLSTETPESTNRQRETQRRGVPGQASPSSCLPKIQSYTKTRQLHAQQLSVQHRTGTALLPSPAPSGTRSIHCLWGCLSPTPPGHSTLEKPFPLIRATANPAFSYTAPKHSQTKT